MILIVCGLDRLPNVIAERRPSHVITLLDPASLIDTPLGIQPERHLRLGVNDINEPAEGLVLPDETVVQQILEFGRTWDEQAPMVVHCWAGISRSTATAFALACERSPEKSELEIAQLLRRSAPHAWPNRRIVALADDMLGRGGRMVDAVDAIGDNGWVTSGVPFDFPARHL
ncbi:MAG TPA: protein-tyrosine phosphatase family protein [Phenylobacterium sp.]